MPDWNEIIAEHGAMVWQTVCRIVPQERAAPVFRDALLCAHDASQRDSVSDWKLFLERVATVRAVASLKQNPPEADGSLPGLLRSRLAHLGSEHTATVFCLRYLSGKTFSEIAIETRANLDSVGPSANDACTTLADELAEAQPQTVDAQDLLENVVTEMRNTPAPPLTQELLEAAKADLAAAPEIDFEKPPVPSRTIPLAIAAAVVLVIGLSVMAYFRYRPKPPAMAFSQMLEAVANEQSARYYMVRNVRLPDQRVRKVQAEIAVLEPGRIRQVMEPPGTIVIWDELGQKKALTLDEGRQRATLRELDDMFDDSRPIDAVTLLKGLQSGEGTPAEQTAIHGRAAQEFRVDRPDMQMSVWADVESKLPVMAELQMKDGAGDALLNEFVWGPPLDAAQFSLEPPAGYELAAIKVNLKPATEQDLVKALDTAARLNGGKFPNSFDRAGMSQLIGDLRKKLPPSDSPERRAAAEELEANLLQLGRGWMFIAEPENGDDWHYTGQGILYGGKAPVLWYRPRDSKAYRIVDASLEVRPILPEKLPDVPSVALSSATTRPTITPQPLPMP